MTKSTKKISYLPVPDEVKNLIHSRINWDSQRNSYYGLEDSRSILLKYNLNYPEGMFPKNHPEQDLLSSALSPAILHVKELLNAAYCSRAIIACVPPGKEVKRHIDPGWTFAIQRRYCWVLKTNDQALTYVSGEEKHFGEGEIWEFNNKEMHGAINNGSEDRIHLIFDLVLFEDALATTPQAFEPGSYDDKFFNIILKKKNKSNIFEV